MNIRTSGISEETLREEERLKSGQKRTLLNIGCGKDIRQGWTNCDYAEGKGVDMVFDLSEGIPLPDNYADHILCAHMLEHILMWHDVPMKEIHRVLKPGGTVEISVPYGIFGQNEPQHLRIFMPGSLDFYCSAHADETIALDVPSFQMFKMKSKKIRRVFWLSWHMAHYLGIKTLLGKRYAFPIGKKAEIIWVLEKV